MTRPSPAHLDGLDEEDDDDGSMYLVSGDEPDPVPVPVGKPTIAKAIIAFVTTLSGTLIVALAENGITATEWVVIATTSVVAALSVYAVTNDPPRPAPFR